MNDSKVGFSSPEAAETAFYSAFTDCNVQAMNAVWADDDVICIHPGSSALVGHDAVMRSWTNILTDADPPNLYIKVISRFVRNNFAVHVLEEHIKPASGATGSTTVILVTNIYHQSDDGWHMVEHHASIPSSSQRQHTLQ